MLSSAIVDFCSTHLIRHSASKATDLDSLGNLVCGKSGDFDFKMWQDLKPQSHLSSSLRGGEKIAPINQKNKDRLAVIGLLALDAFFVFGAVSNFYRYIFLKISLDIYLAVLSTILTAVLTVFLVVLLASYLDKRKFLKSFEK